MRYLGLLAVAVALLSPWNARAEATKSPNVLWICADDLAAYVYGAYGNTIVKTPNLDRLASEGMRFERAYCNSPVCTASRQSFLTGQYPRTLGVTQLKTALPDGTLTLPKMLAGDTHRYDTASIGKMHFNSNLKHGFDFRIDMPEYRKALQARGAKPLPQGVTVLPAWKPFQDPARTWLNSEARPYGAIDANMSGTFFAEQAVKYLEQQRDKPFFLIVSFYEPHSPFHFPVEYRGRHKPEEFTVPKLGPDDDAQIPAIFRDLTDKEKQGINAAYYTSAEFLDKNVGLVLDALRKSGKERDTLVIFTGDHGYMLGQHGRFEKHCCFEPAIRSPLVLRFPAAVQPKQHTDALVEFIDIVPTVLDFCGVPKPASVQGESLVPLLRGAVRTHRQEIFVEYSENEEAAVLSEKWKLIYCTGKREREDGYKTGRPLPGRTLQLFDRGHDPDEIKNLAKSPEHAQRVEEMTKRLAEHLKRTAREPRLLPKDGDVHSLLEFCLQPRDVQP
jgi:arylsulfatase A-like enzyme